jgi:ribulose-5-phosphate 4-epimerase/fuculose-1-phosphate aldolase
VAANVAQAFDELYYLERAARNQVLAMSTGRPLAIVPDDIAELACAQWAEYPEVAKLHFDELRAILDEEEPEYVR